MEDNNALDMSTKLLNNNHFYNVKEEKNPFLLQFKQLKYYYNQRMEFKKTLSNGLDKNDEKINNFIQNEYCLIDKAWLKKWKKHIGYKDIINKIKEIKIERDLDNEDYKWISGIIDKNYKENYLNPLDNNTIYKDNEINPLADFKVIHKESFKLFNINSKFQDPNIIGRTYPISFFKDKYFLYLNDDMVFIAFRQANSHKFNEIVGEFKEIKEQKDVQLSKNQIIDDCFNKDIYKFLKEIHFNFFELEKEIEIHNCKIKIYNKTLLKKAKGDQMRNNVFPNINNERNELLNSNKLPNDLNKIIEMQGQFTNFFLRDIKRKINNNNNNNINTNAVFFKTNQNNKKLNFNNKKIEENNNQNINNNDNATKILMDSRKNINNNNKDHTLNSNNNNNNNEQNNNFSPNNNQQNLSQNQNNNNNNFNYQNIPQTNNNAINNVNNIIQNNNMFMSNNSQPFNQNFNQINPQNNMFQQYKLLLNSAPNLQINNNPFQNAQNNNFNNNKYMMMMMKYFQNFIYNQIHLNNNNGIIYPHKSGLENVGQSCYMNATIECLSNIKEITDPLLCLNENFISKKNNLTLSYRNLLVELFLTQQKVVVPEIFKSVIGELNPLFQGKHAADSKDLLFFLIERLHLENNFENKNIPNIQKNFYQLEIESRNEQLMLQNFWMDYNQKANSIFSKTFYGITESIMDCKGCGIRKFSFQSFNMQIFQLKKLKEDKVLKCQNNGILSLYDAFVLSQMPELLINDNMIYCNHCKALKEGVHQQIIYQLPKVLIIILNRGRNNADFNEGFNFPPILDLSKQNVIINPNSPKFFYLCGVITHFGESGSSGHFIAYCRNNMNDNFTFYNDSIVSEVSVETAISYNISNDPTEKKTPYILFYHYIN